MSLDSIIKADSSSSSSSGGGRYGKNQNRGDRSQQRRTQSKPYNSNQGNRQQRQQQYNNSNRQGGGGGTGGAAFAGGNAIVLNPQGIPQILSLPVAPLNQISIQTMMNQLAQLQSQQQQQQQAAASGLSDHSSMDAAALSQLDTSSLASRILKVSATSNPKTVAGSIAHTSRLGSCPTLLATGPASLNQAIKAIAIARTFLEENRVELSVLSEFRDEERCAVSMVLVKSALRRSNKHNASSSGTADHKDEDDTHDAQELRVAQNSEPSMIAGSIAKKIRAGERLSAVCIGGGAVCATVRGITIARRYLSGDALDVSFRPSFIHLEMEEGQRSAIKFIILAQQV